MSMRTLWSVCRALAVALVLAFTCGLANAAQPLRIGQHARRYFLTGERFDAQTAVRIGLAHDVAADLNAAVETVVAELLTSGPNAVREAKRLIRERPAGDETARIAARMRTADEGQERLRAFLERRDR